MKSNCHCLIADLEGSTPLVPQTAEEQVVFPIIIHAVLLFVALYSGMILFEQAGKRTCSLSVLTCYSEFVCGVFWGYSHCLFVQVSVHWRFSAETVSWTNTRFVIKVTFWSDFPALERKVILLWWFYVVILHTPATLVVGHYRRF